MNEKQPMAAKKTRKRGRQNETMDECRGWQTERGKIRICHWAIEVLCHSFHRGKDSIDPNENPVRTRPSLLVLPIEANPTFSLVMVDRLSSGKSTPAHSI
jgi:hypothetical protein